MGLLDDIRAEPPRHSLKCNVATVKEAMTKKDRSDLEDALADVMIPTATIARVLERNGHKLSAGSIGRHRRGDCACQ
jgi:hypothetical protein